MPTIGVSVAVPDPWGTELQQYRIGMGDASALHIPTHITLLPPHVVEAVTPFRERMTELLDDPAELDRILGRGAERASGIASVTSARVRDAVGLLGAAG